MLVDATYCWFLKFISTQTISVPQMLKFFTTVIKFCKTQKPGTLTWRICFRSYSYGIFLNNRTTPNLYLCTIILIGIKLSTGNTTSVRLVIVRIVIVRHFHKFCIYSDKTVHKSEICFQTIVGTAITDKLSFVQPTKLVIVFTVIILYCSWLKL